MYYRYMEAYRLHALSPYGTLNKGTLNPKPLRYSERNPLKEPFKGTSDKYVEPSGL